MQASTWRGHRGWALPRAGRWPPPGRPVNVVTAAQPAGQTRGGRGAPPASRPSRVRALGVRLGRGVEAAGR